MEFTGTGARRAAAAGRIEQWVHQFMRGSGDNRPLADGLALQPRWWLGPVMVPAGLLRRKTGPEEGMEYRVPADEWEAGLPSYIRAIAAGWDVPPLIAEYVGESELLLADGSHRVEALRALGRAEIEVVIWFNSEAEWASYRLEP